MLFIVATVCVYGLSIIFFIAGHTQKRELNKDEEQQISHYLKRVHLEECSLDDRKFHVIRLKSELLAGSALGQRHDRRISLLRRPQDQGPRLGVGRAEEEEEEEEEDSLHCGAQGPDTPWLNGECSVDDVHEDARPSPKPFRGRRFGCVGFSPAARTSEGPRRPLLTWPLPDIQEDEVPLPSLDDVLSSQHHDPPQIWLPRSAGPPVPDTSPAESAAGGPALQALSSVHAHTSALQALSSSDSMLTQETAQDTAGSHSVVVEELEDGDSSEAEMCTRL